MHQLPPSDEQKQKTEDHAVWHATQPYGTCYPWSFSNMVEALSEMTPQQAEQIREAAKTDSKNAGALLVAVVVDYWESCAKLEVM